MATDRVGIEIDVLGYDEALQQMKTLESSMKGLGGHKQYLKIKAEVEELKWNKIGLQNHKAKLKADISDVESKINRVKDRIRLLEKAKIRFNLDKSGIEKVDARVKELRSEINSLSSTKTNLKSEFAQTTAEINQSTAAINRLNAALKTAGLAGKSLRQIFNSMASGISHAGMALQSAGNALTRASSPFRTLMRGSLYAGGFALLNTASQGLSSGFSRYDTMKKYPRIMQQLGYSAKDTEKSLDKLNNAVLGLPTGLDEIVDVAQRYSLTLGDINKGTELAIASNNAFLASMSTDTQKYQGMMQLQDLMNGKKLRNTEWTSLINSMSAGINEIGKELGYSDNEMKQFRADLLANKIASEDFLDALVKVGTGTGKVAEMAALSKETWEAFTTNVGTAFSRMTYGVLTSLDEISKAASGKTLNMLLTDTVIPGINNMTESVKSWINAHPDEIVEFFTSLKNINWGAIGKGIGDSLLLLGDVLSKLTKIIPNPRALGWLMVLGPMLGSALTVIGGALKGLRHPLAGIGTMLVGISRLAGGAGLAGLGAKLGKAGEWIKGIFTFKAATDTAEEAAKAAATKTVSLKAHFASIAKGLSGIGAVAGGVLIIGGTVFAAVKMIKSIVKDLGTISTDMGNIDVGAMKKLGRWMANIGGIFAILGVIAGAAMRTPIGAGVIVGLEAGLLAIGTIITTISGFAWINSKLISGTLKNLLNAVNSIKDIAQGINDLSGVKIKKKGIKKAIGAISEIAPLLKLSYKDEYGRNVRVSASSIKKSKNVFKNMSSVVRSIKNTATNLEKLADIDISDAKDKALDVVSNMSEIYTELQSSFEVDSKKDVKGTGRASELVGNISAIIGQIKGTVDNIKSLAESGDIDFEGAQAAADKIVTNMHDLYDKIVNAFSPEQTKTVKGGHGGKGREIKTGGNITQGQVDTASNMSTMISSISQTLSQLRGIYDTLAGENGLQNVDSAALEVAAENAKVVIEKIKEIALTMQGFQTETFDSNFENVKAAVGKIKNIVNTFNTLGGGALASTDTAVFTAIESLKAMITQLGTALNTSTIEQLKTQVDTFKAAVDSIFETLNSDFESVEVTVNIDGKVTGHNTLISEINAADRAIRNAVRGIKKSYTKSVSVRINPSVSVGPFSMPLLGGLFSSTGGYIGNRNRPLYRAKGGGIGPFQPRGTDTVPAMLTPGEYVQSRSAVKFFGIEFMRRINNLDIAGAMRELSARAGMNQIASRSTVINNNITNNNNPTINQNIQTNNPNFAFKRSRYAMAL